MFGKRIISSLMVLSVTCIPLHTSALSLDDKVAAEDVGYIASENEFDPESFYHEILNEQRPQYAKGYRFLDLDGDGREELLISSGRIFSIYTADIQNKKPVSLFKTAPDTPYFRIFGNGIVCYNPSPNMHGQAYGHIYYRISEGTLIPIVGYINNSYPTMGYYRTDKKELLNYPPNFDFSKWDEITSEEFHNFYNNNYVCNNITIESFDPYMDSFAVYDAEIEFHEKNKETPLAVSGRYGYDELIQRYKELFASPNLIPTLNVTQGINCLNTDNYSFLLREYTYTNPCFILRDLNNDGTYELITGCQENDGTFTLFDIYTLKNNKVVHIAASGWRDRFSIGRNNEIIESGSSGAADGMVINYTLNNGKLKPIRMLSVEKGQYYYYYNFGTAIENKQEITREEYLEKDKLVYAPDEKQDVILFKDWYSGMRLSDIQLGDVTDDGIIDGRDATAVLTEYAMTSTGKKSQFNEDQIKAADVNKDNIVDGRDATTILTYYAYTSTGHNISLEEFVAERNKAN